jgi:hypothetical protein
MSTQPEPDAVHDPTEVNHRKVLRAERVIAGSGELADQWVVVCEYGAVRGETEYVVWDVGFHPGSKTYDNFNGDYTTSLPRAMDILRRRVTEKNVGMIRKIEFKARMEVDPAILNGIVTTALEGGIGYWSTADQYSSTAPNVFAVVRELDDDGDVQPNAKRLRIDPAVVLTGIERILNDKLKVRSDIRETLQRVMTTGVDSDIDAAIADCIVQAALFNNIEYS